MDKHTVRFSLKEPFVWFSDMVANPLAIPFIAPFADTRAVELYGQFERGIYEVLKTI